VSVSTPKSREERLREAIRIKRAQNRGRSDAIPRRAAGTQTELHELQRGMWLAHSLEPDSPAYNLVSACRVHGQLALPALEQSYRELLSRHRLLRSTFVANGNSVEQVIHDTVPDALERFSAKHGELENVATVVAGRPFDLSKPPLVRLALVEDERGERILLLMLHHLLADERSLAGLWRELAQLMSGTAPPASSAQYDDWSAWQRARDSAEPASAEGDFDYWRQRLSPPPEELSLPFVPPAAAPDRPGRLLVTRLGQAQADELRTWAAARGTTPFVVGAFACKLLLQRLAKDPGFAVGTPVSLRHHPDMLPMVGAFINPVLITGVIDEADTSEDALHDFDRALRDNLAHGSTPFSRLAESLAPAGSQGGHPLFQAMFVHQEYQPLPQLGEARLEPLMLDLGVAKFDLTLFLVEQGQESEGGTEVALEYRQDRFRASDMGRLLEAYGELLHWLTRNPQRPVSDFDPVSDADRSWLADAAEGESLAPGCDLLPAQIARQARERPEAPAVSSGGKRLGYADLQARAGQVSAALAGAGVRAGDRVGLYLPRGGDLVAGILGILNRRAAYVPLDPAWPAARSEAVLGDAAVRAVLSTEALAPTLPTGDWPVVTLESPEAPSAAIAQEALATSPGDPAYLLYTSGSTGRPKGVVVTQANLQASTAARLQVYGAVPPRFLLLPSVAFDSSVAGIFGTLAAGGTLVIPTDEAIEDPRQLARLIRSERVSHLLCVPSLYAALLDADENLAKVLSGVIVAGEHCPAGLVRRHFGSGSAARLFNEYGPTEGTVWATVHELTPDFAGSDVPIGRPIPGVRIDLLDGQGRLLPPGMRGEAWLSGPTVAAGYWNRPEQSTERFRDRLPGATAMGPFYRTGDILSWDADGVLHFHGRADEQIKLRGFRIEPGEVEAALAALPGVGPAAVVARRLGAGDDASHHGSSGPPEHLVAFVEDTGEAEAPGDDSVGKREPDWRGALAGHLPAYAVPTRLVRLDRLPRLPNGKIDRRRLMTWPLEASTGTVDPEALSPTEASLKQLWAGLLARDDMGPTDNFFILGGTSLLAVQVALAVEREFGVVLPPSEVFSRPTLGALAARIDQEAPEDDSAFDHLFPIETSGSGDPLIFAIPHFFTDLVADRFRGERPVWGMRGIGHRPEGNLGRWPTMEALGADLVSELDRRFPGRPVILAGYSFGASMALELARQLEQRGSVVQRLYLIAPMPFDRVRVGPLRLQLDGLRQPPDSLSAREALGRWLRVNHPLSVDFYRRLWRRTGIEGWRRYQCWRGRARRRRGLPLTEAMQWSDVRVERFRLHTKYQPGTTAVPTVIFNGIEPETDAAATWRAHFSGPFEVVPIPDPHGDEQAVNRARDVILETLAQGESPAPGRNPNREENREEGT
jgi:amino acid adenylation domain-containing protein